MLVVTGIWIYLFLTTFLIGYGILQGLTSLVPYQVRHADTYLFCGLAAVTVYAQFFSLFGSVGPAANLLLVAVCIGILWGNRQKLYGVLSEMCRGIWEKKCKGFLLLVLFFLFAYGTSRGILHYDTGLYHAQSIRWLEEYGVVKGLGNLHCRLAYNSSSFALSALYSMAALGEQSYHCAAGWLAFLLAKICSEIAGPLRRGRLRTSDFARVMGVYYLVIIFDEMISPASDYFMVLLAFYIVIRWLELIEGGSDCTQAPRIDSAEGIFPYAMLCVMGVFLMTVKLSAALILLLTIYPACYLLKGRRWKETGLYLLLGIVTAFPFFARNIILSGWLVYPFTQLDLFDVKWKIPKGVADYDAKEIQVWGRGYSDVTRYEIPIEEWLPDWFRSLPGSDRVLVAMAAAAVIVLFVYAAGMFSGFWSRRWELILVQVTMAASFLFWLGTSPLIRYGCVYVYLTSAVVFGGIYDGIVSGEKKMWSGRAGGEANRTRQKNGYTKVRMPLSGNGMREAVRLAGIAAVILLLAYKCLALGREIALSYENAYWLVQKDYENYETDSYLIEGVEFYCPVYGDQTGYDAFPSAPVRAEIGFLGTDMKDGFFPYRIED